MSIRFKCSGCGKAYQVDDALAGRRVKCKGCEAPLTIPSPSPAPSPGPDLYGLDEVGDESGASPLAAPLPPMRGRGGRSAAGSGGGLPVGWLVGGGVLAVVALAAVLFIAFGPSGGGKPGPGSGEPAGADEVAAADDPAPAALGPVPAVPRAAQARPGAAPASSSSWRVEVDPAPADQVVAIPTGGERSISIPPSYGGADQAVLYPTTPSPFVCLGGNDAKDHRREVHDLRDGKVVGRLTGRLDLNAPLALSPDGRFLVAYANQAPRSTVVWSVAEGTQVAAIKEEISPATVLDFVGPDRILIAAPPWKKLEIWDFRAGTKVREVAMTDGWNWRPEGFALSPGRRFAALIFGSDARLRVWDLNTGARVGEVELPTDGNYDPDPVGIAFSPDGTLLTALLKLHNTFRLITWDVASGNQDADLTVEGGADAFGGHAPYNRGNLQWLPDQSGWLVKNQYLVERRSGQKVWTVPFDSLKLKQPASPRRMIDPTHMLVVIDQKDQDVLKLVSLPADRIAAAMGAARGGGSASDALLPPLATIDLAAATRVPIPAGETAWAVRPDPAGPGKTLVTRGVPLRARVHELIGMAWSDPGVGQAVVLSGPGGPYAAKANADQGGLPRHAERVDLAAGRSLGRIELPAVYDLLAMSPDGAFLLLTTAQGRDRLDVVEAATGKPVVSWRPGTGAIAWADFQARDRVLSMGADGTLVLWTLPDAKPVYVAENVGQGRPALSPGRALVAAFGAGRVLFLDAATGAIRGRAALPSGDGSGVTAAAFRPDGSELAALAGGKLVRWDLASDGAVIQESPAPLTIPCDRMVYHGPDHLMLAGHWLYDIAHQSIVWAYPNGMPSPVSPDGAHWYAAAAENIGAAFLKAIAVPNRDVTQAESLAFGADAKPNAQVKALLRRGATVAIRVEGGPPRQADEFRAKLIEAFRGRLAAIGVKTADEAPVRLVIRFTERDVPGAKIEIRLSRPGAGAMETREIPARGIDWEVALADPTGTPIVLHAEKGGPLGFGFLNIPPGETDLEGIVRLRLYESVRDQRVVRIDLPYFVARRAGGALLVPGTTDLGHPRTTFASTGPIFAPPPPP